MLDQHLIPKAGKNEEQLAAEVSKWEQKNYKMKGEDFRYIAMQEVRERTIYLCEYRGKTSELAEYCYGVEEEDLESGFRRIVPGKEPHLRTWALGYVSELGQVSIEGSKERAEAYYRNQRKYRVVEWTSWEKIKAMR